MADIEAIGSSQFGNFSNINTGKNYQRYGSATGSMAVSDNASSTFINDGSTTPNGNPAQCFYASNTDGAVRSFTTTYPAAFATTGPTTFSFYVLPNGQGSLTITLRNASSKASICVIGLDTVNGTFTNPTNLNNGTKVSVAATPVGSTPWKRVSFVMTGYTGAFELNLSIGNLAFNPSVPAGRYMMNFGDWQLEYERDRASSYSLTNAVAPTENNPGARALVYQPDPKATGESTFGAFTNVSAGRNRLANSGQSNLVLYTSDYNYAGNSVNGPFGSNTGDVYTAKTSGNAPRFFSTQNGVAFATDNTGYTISFYALLATNYLYFQLVNSASQERGSAYLDMAAMEVAQVPNQALNDFSKLTFKIEDAGNNWRRISVSFRGLADSGIRWIMAPSDTATNYSTNATAGTALIYTDGWQIENNETASAYDPTGATAPNATTQGAYARRAPTSFATSASVIGAFRNTTTGVNVFPNSGNASLYTALTVYTAAAFTISDNVIDAPTGTMQGDRFTTTGAGSGRRYANVNLTPATDGRQMTISFYVKTTRAFFYLGIDNSNAVPVPAEACFNMSTFAATPFNASRDATYGTTYTVVDAGDGWRRISTTFKPTSGLNLRLYLSPSDATGSPSYNASAGDVFYFDGMQVEYSSAPTAYQKTGATAPSDADGASGKLGLRLLSATGETTIGNYTSNSAANVRTPALATGASLIAEFRNTTTTNNVFPNSGEPSKWVNFRFGGVAMTENVISSPVGSMSGYSFSATASGNATRYVNMGTTTAILGTGAVMTHSWYIKSDTALFYFGVDFNGNAPAIAEAYFNLQTSTFTSPNPSRDASNAASYSITDAGGGWRRIVASFRVAAGSRYLIYTTPMISTASTQSSATAGQVLFYADGFQIEPGATATPYMKTGATAPSTVPGATGNLGSGPLDLTLAQTVGPFTSNAAGLVVPVRDAIGETTFGKFYNVSEGYNIFARSGSLNLNFNVNDRMDANVASSPLGAGRADAHVSVEAGDRDRILFYRGAALTVDGGDWVFSFYAKTQQPYLTINMGSATAADSRLVPLIDTRTGTLVKWGANTPYSLYDPSVVVYPFEDGWARYSLSFKNFTTTTDTLGFTIVAHATEFNVRSNVPANGTVVLLDGFQLERGRLPRAYQETDTPVPNQNVAGARAEMIYPTLLANAETTLDAFTSNAAAMYVNLATATQSFPGRFTQEAYVSYAPLSLYGTSTFGEFMMNAGKATSFYGRSAINVGRASTTREVFHPANLKVGDLIVLIAGSHSDGYDDIDLDVDSDFKFQGMVRGPSVRPGYRQSLWMWTKEATADDVMSTVYYNLPSNYTDPVVWAQSYVFSNASRVEGFVSHVDAEDTFSSASPQVSSFNAGRTAVLVWQASTVTSTSGPGFWEASTQSSSIGPGFTTVIEYASLKDANTLSKTRSWGAQTKAMAVGFSVVPTGSEGSVLINAVGDSTIDAFRSIKTINSETETTFDNFASVGRQIMAVEGDQKIAPFTSNSVGNVVVSANASTTAFGSFTSRGFETIALYGNSKVPAFTSNASILSRSTISGRSFVGEFVSNTTANVFLGLAGNSQINAFTSDRVMVFSNTAVTVGEYVSNATARALVMANTANVAMGTFTSTTTAGPIVQATSNTLLDDFISDNIRTDAVAVNMVGEFTANATSQAIVSANTISSFDNFTQEAGNVIFIRDNVPMEEFTSNAVGEVLILANAVTDLGEFTFTPRPGTRVRNIVSSRSAMRMAAVTQQVIMEFVEPTREATGESSFGEFGSEGSARVLTRSLEHGGVKFKGSFKGGLSNGSPNIRISGRKRI